VLLEVPICLMANEDLVDEVLQEYKEDVSVEVSFTLSKLIYLIL
jgi:hypothetical protein